jgi:tRNA (adenine22-N1)-methyltransferase
MVKNIKLPDRLKAIAAYINDGAAVADIGTDHGLLPVYLARNRLARRLIASDISADSLKAALRSAEKHNVTEKIEFITAPGLEGVVEADVDTVVVAGMGGETIAGILSDASWIKHRDIKLILQPQSRIDVLCRFLYDNGHLISDTKTILDRGRQYTIIVAA